MTSRQTRLLAALVTRHSSTCRLHMPGEVIQDTLPTLALLFNAMG